MRWVLEDESFCFLFVSLNIFDNYDFFFKFKKNLPSFVLFI